VLVRRVNIKTVDIKKAEVYDKNIKEAE